MSSKRQDKSARKPKKVASKAKAVVAYKQQNKSALPMGFSSNITNSGSFLTNRYDIALNHYFQPLPFKEGKTEGSRVRGCFPLALVNINVGTGQGDPVLIGFGFESSQTETIHLNPQYINPSASVEFNYFKTFTRFRYNRLKLHYTSITGSNQTQSVIIGYVPDGAIVSGDVTSTGALFSPGSMICSSWFPLKTSNCDGLLVKDDWFMVDFDDSVTATDADYRQSFQGAVIGVNYIGAAVGSALGIGQVWMEYEIDVIEPRYVADYATLSAARLQKSFSSLARRHEKKREDLKIVASALDQHPLQDGEPISDEYPKPPMVHLKRLEDSSDEEPPRPSEKKEKKNKKS